MKDGFLKREKSSDVAGANMLHANSNFSYSLRDKMAAIEMREGITANTTF
jgi:hypothetical protein